MLMRAFRSDVPADWVVGDTVYGYDELRVWLDQQEKNYVVAVPGTHAVWVQGLQQPVGLVAALLPQEAWVVLSAGEGSIGPRLYGWAWLQLPEQGEGNERARWANENRQGRRQLLLFDIGSGISTTHKQKELLKCAKEVLSSP
jgi:SRSO17 transposase